MGQVVSKSDKDHDVVRSKCHGGGKGEQKRAAKHRDDVGGRGQVEFADRMADDGCASNHDHALKGGITQA